MPLSHSNGVDIYFERRGEGPPLLLVMGLAGQLIDWPEPLVAGLAQRFEVITFDNRDAGLSTNEATPPPTRRDLARAALRRRQSNGAYSLSDMARDAIGVLDTLGIEQAHVVGMSMGGMIAQLVAIEHTERCLSLCSMMSTTGNPRVGRPTPRVLAAMARRDATTADRAVEQTVDFFRLVGGTDWDEHEQRRRARRSVERAFSPHGVLRQLGAIVAADDRTPRLAELTLPALVVHGLDDRLVSPSGGTATARAISGSRLLMFAGMGHDLPSTRHDEIVEAIALNTERAN